VPEEKQRTHPTVFNYFTTETRSSGGKNKRRNVAARRKSFPSVQGTKKTQAVKA
jgi:hypothetical protein